MESAEIGAWLDRLDADRENVRAAIAFAVSDGDADTALALGADVWRYWIWRGSLTEGRELLASALAFGGGPPALRQRALNGAGAVAGEQGDFDAAKALFEQSVELGRRSATTTAPPGSAATSGRWRSTRSTSTRRSPGSTPTALHARDRRPARAEPDAAEPRDRPRRRRAPRAGGRAADRERRARPHRRRSRAHHLGAAHARAPGAGQRRRAPRRRARAPARGDAALGRPPRAPGPDRVARDAGGRRHPPGRPAHRRAADRRGQCAAPGGGRDAPARRADLGAGRRRRAARRRSARTGSRPPRPRAASSTSPTPSPARWRSAHADLRVHPLLLVAEHPRGRRSRRRPL